MIRTATLCAVALLAGQPAVSAASVGSAVERITIDDALTWMPGSSLITSDEQIAITRSGNGYIRTIVSAHSSGGQAKITASAVENFVRLVDAWRYPSASPQALGLTTEQQQMLKRHLARCAYGEDASSALAAYYLMSSIWTNDYPTVRVEIRYAGGQVAELWTRNQQLFGLPWRKQLSQGQESLSFDAELSQAILPLLDDGAPNAARFKGTPSAHFNGGTRFGVDPLEDVAAIACYTSGSKVSP